MLQDEVLVDVCKLQYLDNFYHHAMHDFIVLSFRVLGSPIYILNGYMMICRWLLGRIMEIMSCPMRVETEEQDMAGGEKVSLCLSMYLVDTKIGLQCLNFPVI